MKKMIFLAAATLSTSVLADWTAKPSNEIYNLMYMTNTGKWSSSTSYNSFEADSLTYEVGGARVFTLKNSSTNLKQTFSYGLSSQIELGVGLGYQFEDKTTYDFGPGSIFNGTSANVKESGLLDSSIKIRYRALSQQDSFGDLDLKLDVSPKLGKRKAGNGNANGNAYRGGSLTTLGIEYGHNYTSMGWALGYENNMHGKTQATSASDSTSTKQSDSYTDSMIYGGWQWVFGEKIILNIGYAIGSVSSQKTTNSDATYSITDKTSYSSTALDLSYLINKTSLVGLKYISNDIDKTNVNSSGTSIPVGDRSTSSVAFNYNVEL